MSIFIAFIYFYIPVTNDNYTFNDNLFFNKRLFVTLTKTRLIKNNKSNPCISAVKTNDQIK